MNMPCNVSVLVCLEQREFSMTGPGELGRKWFRECGWREGGRVVV